MASRTPSPVSSATSGVRVSKNLIETVLPFPERIRNVCILAHVDHGKTTLTDSLIASNGIISFKQAGRLRYLDSREDEQERGITMESSAISLLFDYRLERDTSDSQIQRHLINLIDSPGHVDFSRQVVTATRLCDGCLVLVDAVEGVCTQTMAVLRQAYRDRLMPCLVINKVDRLITELKLSTKDAFTWINQLIEQVNAVQASIMRSDELKLKEDDSNCGGGDMEDFSFDPVKGNVAFASSTDGWAFRIMDFVPLIAKKVGMDEASLGTLLWGEYFFDAKAKKIIGKTEAEERGLAKTTFAQFILDSIWAVYDATLVNWDEAKIEKISAQMNVRLVPKDLKNKDGKNALRTLMGQWLPIAEAIFSMMIEKLPSPIGANSHRIASLINVDKLNDDNRVIVDQMIKTESPNASPSVAFVSKLIPVIDPRSYSSPATLAKPVIVNSDNADAKPIQDLVANLGSLNLSDPNQDLHNHQAQSSKDKNFIAMARLFHGTLSVGQKVFILLQGGASAEVEVQELYLLMGRDVEAVQKVYCGNVFGIGKIGHIMGKFGTISSDSKCPMFGAMKGEINPIVRVAVRPAKLEHLPDVIDGLQVLCQADPCAETYLQEENGEHILATAGELHLEQCLKDLAERYTRPGVELVVSPPMVPFRETISMEKNRNEDAWKIHVGYFDTVDMANGRMALTSVDGRVRVGCRALPLPESLTNFIVEHQKAIRSIMTGKSGQIEALHLAQQLEACLGSGDCQSPWNEFKSTSIWAFGPRNDGPNLLLCSIPSEADGPFFNLPQDLAPFKSSIQTAFRLITEKGPMAHEPMMGVGFIIDEITIIDAPTDPEELCQFQTMASANLISLGKALFEASFLFWSPRLMLAYYDCSIQTSAEMLGKVYSALNKRHGLIDSEDYHDETGFFTVNAKLPVVESFGFTDELRGRTAGLAIPQLIFSGFQVLGEDPYWLPMTEDELEEHGAVNAGDNLAARYLINIRERKGLFTEKKVVQSAEKQRTLKR